MKADDAAAVTSAARSALLAATSCDAGDDAAAERALRRARAQLSGLGKRWPVYARVPRVARRPIKRAEEFLAAASTGKVDPEELDDLFRAVERAVRAALSEAKAGAKPCQSESALPPS